MRRNKLNEPEIISSLLNYNIENINSGNNHNIILGYCRNTNIKKLFVFGDNSKGQLGIEKSEEGDYLFIPFENKYFENLDNLFVQCGENISSILNKKGEVFIFGRFPIMKNRKGYNIFKEDIFIPIKLFENITQLDEIFNQKYSSEYLKFESIRIHDNSLFLKLHNCYDINNGNIIFIDDCKNFLFAKNLFIDRLENLYYDNAKKIIYRIISSNEFKIFDKENKVIIKEIFNDEYKEIKTIHKIINNDENQTIKNETQFDIEEFTNYISLISNLTLNKKIPNNNISFRPKNLPKKIEREEIYHRKLVEDNKKEYEKKINQEKIKLKNLKIEEEKRKLKQIEIEKLWNEKIFPNWHKYKYNKNIKKFFYEGLPISMRGKIWLLCLGNNFSITPEYYEIEVKKAIDILILTNENQINSNNEEEIKLYYSFIKKINKENSIKYIDLDITRTFSYLGIFKEGSPMSEDLREILRAFVISRPDIGYIQGLSYIAGLLLIYMSKFQAFVSLLNLVLHSSILSFYRFDEYQIRNRLQIFKQIFYINLPNLCDHFESINLLPEHYIIEWFMTLFSKNLNIDLTSRVWDIYMIDGTKVIYQVSIVILSFFENKFLEEDFDYILKEIKSIQFLNFDEDIFISSMKNVKFLDWILDEINKLDYDYIPTNN